MKRKEKIVTDAAFSTDFSMKLFKTEQNESVIALSMQDYNKKQNMQSLFF